MAGTCSSTCRERVCVPRRLECGPGAARQGTSPTPFVDRGQTDRWTPDPPPRIRPPSWTSTRPSRPRPQAPFPHRPTVTSSRTCSTRLSRPRARRERPIPRSRSWIDSCTSPRRLLRCASGSGSVIPQRHRPPGRRSAGDSHATSPGSMSFWRRSLTPSCIIPSFKSSKRRGAVYPTWSASSRRTIRSRSGSSA